MWKLRKYRIRITTVLVITPTPREWPSRHGVPTILGPAHGQSLMTVMFTLLVLAIGQPLARNICGMDTCNAPFAAIRTITVHVAANLAE